MLERALQVVRSHEGGFANDPDDPGGSTNFGISLRWLREIGDDLADVDGDGDVDATDVRLLKWETAAHLYTAHFWARYKYDLLPEDVAVKVFDLSVNTGPSQAHKLVQRGLRACQVSVTEDGIIGPKTRAAIATVAAILVPAVRSEAAGFYRVLVAQKAVRQKWLAGWLARAYA